MLNIPKRNGEMFHVQVPPGYRNFTFSKVPREKIKAFPVPIKCHFENGFFCEAKSRNLQRKNYITSQTRIFSMSKNVDKHLIGVCVRVRVLHGSTFIAAIWRRDGSCNKIIINTIISY